MSEIFLENPLSVYITLFFVELILGVFWATNRRRGLLYALIVPPLAGAILGLVAHIVVTDREKILSAVNDISQAISTYETQRIPRYLDDEFRGTFQGKRILKGDVVALCDANIRVHEISAFVFRNVSLEIKSDTAKMHGSSIITYSRDFKMSLVWNMDWIKRADKWLIIRIYEPRHGFEF